MSSQPKMNPSPLIRVALTAASLVFVASVIYFFGHPHEPNTQNNSIDIIQTKKTERLSGNKTESIFEKTIRSSKLDLTNPKLKMDFIDELIDDDTYPHNAMAAKGKLHSDLNFLLSLEQSYEQLHCVDKILRNYTRDSMASATNPEDYLVRISMLAETLHAFDSKINYEQLMQAVTDQTTKAILPLSPSISQQYTDALSGTLPHGEEISEVSSRILGGLIAHRLKNEPSTTIQNLTAINDESLRIGTEKALLRDNSIDPTTKQNFAAYYLSADCRLPHDTSTEKNLFGLGIKYDPEAISSMIGNAPPGPKKDFAIEHLVFRCAADDPERSKLWLDLIEDPSVKARAEKYLYKNK